MNSNIITIALLQIMILCTPLTGQAAALDRDKAHGQLWSVDRELFENSLKQRDSNRVKSHRMTLPRARVRIHAGLRQGDLLQELLTPEVVRHGSFQKSEAGEKSQENITENSRQESLLLKEFTAEASIP